MRYSYEAAPTRVGRGWVAVAVGDDPMTMRRDKDESVEEQLDERRATPSRGISSFLDWTNANTGGYLFLC